MIENENYPSEADYTHAVDEVLRFYKCLDEAAASLPMFSITPLLKYLWASIKLEFAWFADVFLIIPINVVVLIRNIFPGQWSFKSFSYPYFKIMALWVWNGECSIPGILIRPLTTYLLHWHIRSRLVELRRQLMQETDFAEDAAKTAFVKIDRAINVWQPAGVGSIILTWVFPAVGPAMEILKWIAPATFPPWTGIAAVFSISYVLNVLTAAFLVKRGILLGGTGMDACYPGFLSGRGGYDEDPR
jgi:hypothetical protein